MQYLRHFLFSLSLTIVLFGGFFIAMPSVHAAEIVPSFINTVLAKEEAYDSLTIAQRKAILSEIIATSQDEIDNITKALAVLELEHEWDIARTYFLNRLATSSEYYASLEEQLTPETLSLDDIKSIAKELKEQREAIYTPELKTAGNMILIFQTNDVRRIVQARNEKIADDIKKLDRQKLVNTETLKKYLSQADGSIKNATVLNAKAKDIYFKETVRPLQPKTDKQTELSEETPLLSEKDEQEAVSSETIANKPFGFAQDRPSVAKAMADKQDEIRELAKESLKELKTAYELFFKMNDRIRK